MISSCHMTRNGPGRITAQRVLYEPFATEQFVRVVRAPEVDLAHYLIHSSRESKSKTEPRAPADSNSPRIPKETFLRRHSMDLRLTSALSKSRPMAAPAAAPAR